MKYPIITAEPLAARRQCNAHRITKRTLASVRCSSLINCPSIISDAQGLFRDWFLERRMS